MVAGLLTAPGTALAKSDNGHGKTPKAGKTCVELTGNWVKGSPSGDSGFTIGPLAPGQAGCWDWTPTPAGDWTISFSDNGSDPYVLGLLLRVMDSLPGDVCWETYLKEGSLADVILPVQVPAATIDACGAKSSYEDQDQSLFFMVSVAALGNLNEHHGGPNHPQPTDISVTVGPLAQPGS